MLGVIPPKRNYLDDLTDTSAKLFPWSPPQVAARKNLLLKEIDSFNSDSLKKIQVVVKELTKRLRDVSSSFTFYIKIVRSTSSFAKILAR